MLSNIYNFVDASWSSFRTKIPKTNWADRATCSQLSAIKFQQFNGRKLRSA